MKNNSNKHLIHSLFYTTLLLLLFSCGEGDSSRKTGLQHQANSKDGRSSGKGKRAAKPTPIEVIKAHRALAASYYVTTSTIEPSSDAKINARTAGVVKNIFHEEGDDVDAGEVLLKIDDDDQRLRLNQARQKLASTRREYERLNKMKKAGVVSPTEWEATENAYRNAETEKELADLALSYTNVSAPFAGRVVWREVDLGAHISQGEMLFRMMAINPLLIRVHIPANRLGTVATGQKVELKLDSVSDPVVGVIELVSPIVNPTTGTIKVTLKLDNYPAQVRPGDFTEVHMVTDKHENALMVPSTAIIEERGQHFLYSAEDNVARKKSVVTGFIMSETTEILSGIDSRDLIVIKGQRNLNDGVKIEILNKNFDNGSHAKNGEEGDSTLGKNNQASRGKK